MVGRVRANHPAPAVTTFIPSEGRVTSSLVCLLAVPFSFADSEPAPQWIWLAEAKPKQQAFFRKEFELPGGVKSAKLYAACDNECTVWIDGKEVLKHNEWSSPVHVDVAAAALGNGKHVLAVRARNTEGPAGLVVRLAIETGGKPIQIVSDGSWKSSDRQARDWQKVGGNVERWQASKVVAKLGDAPWNSVTEQKFAAAGKKREAVAMAAEAIKSLPGYKVERLYTVPRATEGSWVNMCPDPKGRLYVSDQYGPLFRVTPPPIGSTAKPKVERVELPIGESHGLLWAFDSLYVVVNKGEKYESGLYRCRDTNGDDKLDEVKLLKKIDGAGEHGPHAVMLNPDGKGLTIVCGNATKFMKVKDSRVPTKWGEDHLLPRMPDGNGFMKDVLAPGGCIYSTDPDGKDWTLLSMGYRNQFDAAYNRQGDLFTYDADMEWDMNTPWYRPTRVCLATSGSEYGWRNGAGKWPPYYPDNLPPIVEIGPGSPTGVCFGYGAKFPPKYQDAFYICDWSYGKLYAVHLKPSGGSYTAELEEFVSATPMPLTDAVVNPVDGAMYFTVGGRRTSSALYRVTYVGNESTSPLNGVPELTADQQLRRNIETHHRGDFADSAKEVWPALGHSDRFIRFAARVALEMQPIAKWLEPALAETNPQSSLTALLAVARYGDKAVLPRLLDSLARIDVNALTVDQRLEWHRVHQVAFVRMGKPDAANRTRLLALLEKQFPAADRRENAEIAQMLVYLESPVAAAKLVPAMLSAPTQEEELDYARTLRPLRVGWTNDLRKQYFGWLYGRAATLKGGHSLAGTIKIMRTDAGATLTDAEKVAVKAIMEAPPPKASTPVFKERPFVKKWTIDELLPIVETRLVDRNFANGRKLFSETKCFACHRFAFEGGSAGPDLTAAAGRFSKRDLLENIVEPSKVISDQYGAVVILTTEGETVTGRIVNHSGDNIMVMTDMLNPDGQKTVSASKVEKVVAAKTSMMPNGLLDTLKEEEVLDLMAFLLSKGDSNSPMFKK
jgi:putative heme-binding domain-containing protein